jgi:hypothetical protein
MIYVPVKDGRQEIVGYRSEPACKAFDPSYSTKPGEPLRCICGDLARDHLQHVVRKAVA